MIMQYFLSTQGKIPKQSKVYSVQFSLTEHSPSNSYYKLFIKQQRMQNKRRSQIKSQYYHRISNMQTVFSVKNVFKLETKNKTVIKLYI